MPIRMSDYNAHDVSGENAEAVIAPITAEEHHSAFRYRFGKHESVAIGIQFTPDSDDAMPETLRRAAALYRGLYPLRRPHTHGARAGVSRHCSAVRRAELYGACWSGGSRA